MFLLFLQIETKIKDIEHYMVNRHFLRQKILQSLYAYFLTDEKDMKKQEKFLFDNISKLYELEIGLLACVLEIRNIEEEHIEEAKHKFFPTEAEKNPKMRFVNSLYIQRLQNHEELNKAIEKFHINTIGIKDVLKRIMNHFRFSESFEEYMKKEETTYEEDRRIYVQLFKNYLIKDESLFDILCDKGFTWECDYEYVCQVVLQWLKTWAEEDSDQKPLPYPFDKIKDEYDETDVEFTTKLFRQTINNHLEYEQYIEKRSQNWDRDRLAFIDVIIIKMAMTEFIFSPSIPLRVTLNEYIELAKEFSTDKSRLFVNGILDRLITDLRVDNKIQKDEDEDLYFENAGYWSSTQLLENEDENKNS